METDKQIIRQNQKRVQTQSIVNNEKLIEANQLWSRGRGKLKKWKRKKNGLKYK